MAPDGSIAGGVSDGAATATAATGAGDLSADAVCSVMPGSIAAGARAVRIAPLSRVSRCALAMHVCAPLPSATQSSCAAMRLAVNESATDRPVARRPCIGKRSTVSEITGKV
jgi:hypothetical protein